MGSTMMPSIPLLLLPRSVATSVAARSSKGATTTVS
jgi:hypothetical protein